MRFFPVILLVSVILPRAAISQASRAQAENAIQNMRTRQMNEVSNLGKDDKPASASWKSLSAEQADDPTISALSVKEDVPREARKAAEKAEHLAKKGRHEEAIAGFQQALTIDPHYYEAGNNLALEFEAIGQTAEAEKVLRNLTHSAPAHILAFGNLAALLAKQGLYAEAEAVSREALALHRYSFRASYFLGTALVNQGKWNDEAKRNLEYAQIRYPEALVSLKNWPDKTTTSH
jgi:tetratricopeptide (TPR) repeat protein